MIGGSVLPVVIAGTGSALPKRAVLTTEVVDRAFPDADPSDRRRMVELCGIDRRYWIEPGGTAAALGSAALRQALERARLTPGELRRIIFVSSTGGDHLVPSTAQDLVASLDLSDTCDAFDLSNSCAGFLSAFDVGARSVATGWGPVAIVAVETFSRLLSPKGRRAYVVLGDAAAAAILGRAERGGVLASCLRSSRRLRGKMAMAVPGTPDARPFHDFDARTHEIADTAIACVKSATDEVLRATGMALSDVDWIVLHQPNGSLYQTFLDALRIDPNKTVNVVRDIGSVGSASVPWCLDRLLRERPVSPGQRILMASVGAGTTYGAIIYEVGS
jgi:3-oxoacyl-(acyl-carrier-protein) synthase III